MLNVKGKNIAYKSNSSKSKKNLPTIVFLGGLMSDKNSTKAMYVHEYCEKHDLNFIRFDYTGHGESSGQFTDGTITTWLEDTLDVIDNLTKGKVILVGSSMGGWMALLTALARQRICGIVGIATAADFTEELIWKKLTLAQQDKMMTRGKVSLKGGDNNEYSYVFTKQLIIDGKKYCLLQDKININKPVILLHGIKDKTVPVEFSLKISENIASENVKVILSKNSGHKMSSDDDLKLLSFAIDSLIHKKFRQFLR